MSYHRARLNKENIEKMQQVVGLLKDASAILKEIEYSEDVQEKWTFPHAIVNSHELLACAKWDLTRDFLL